MFSKARWTLAINWCPYLSLIVTSTTVCSYAFLKCWTNASSFDINVSRASLGSPCTSWIISDFALDVPTMYFERSFVHVLTLGELINERFRQMIYYKKFYFQMSSSKNNFWILMLHHSNDRLIVPMMLYLLFWWL